jgi:hypothetical protein
MQLRSVAVYNFAVLYEGGIQSSPSKRLHSIFEQILRAGVRKLAISLVFPLLEKFNMPIKLV